MNRKVLIVSPRFPPINAPDHQRVRMALPYFEQFGWEATVLAVRPECVEGVQDPLLGRSLPEGVRVEWVKALPVRWTRRLGVGSLSFRAWRYLARAGRDLLRRDRFDLMFFSTTEFPLMALGPRWLREHGVPYVLDIQDPWVNDYYDRHPEAKAPGGRLKHGVSQWIARWLEPKVLANAAHVVCVSSAYTDMFWNRYADLHHERFTVLPFGAAEEDFETLRRESVRQTCFDAGDGMLHWVYVGAVSASMVMPSRAFLLALRRAADQSPELQSRLRVHFIGTNYASGDRAQKIIEPVARDCGVADMVTEQPERVPYFQALKCLCDAHALIVPGSDDPGYTASKLYPYILARKPLLAIFHAKSSVVRALRETRAGTLVTFDERHDAESLAAVIDREWFQRWPVPIPQTDWQAFEPYTARAMTHRLCQVFDKL